MRIAWERRNVLPCFLRNTYRVNFYRRSKTQRAKNCIAIFFPPAIFKLLERVRLPSRNSFSSLRNMFMFTPDQRSASGSFLLGIKVRRYLLHSGTVAIHTLYGMDFFYQEHQPTEISSQRVCCPFSIPFGSRRAVLREITEGRKVAGYTRGEQSSPFIQRSLLYAYRKRQMSRMRRFLSSF